MMLNLRSFSAAVAVCALVAANSVSLSAATIIKLNLGNVSPDLQMNVAGVLGTANDGNGATAGDQDTNIDFTGFLEPAPDVTTSIASFSLSGLTRTGAADLSNPGLVAQNFVGGVFSLYDPSNTLLLSGTISTSSLLGTLTPPGVGSTFTTGTVLVTGGVLADLIVPNSLALSMNLTNVNGGSGFTVTGGVLLNPFLADTSVVISGTASTVGQNFPEPSSLVLVAGAMFAATGCRRRFI